MNPRSAWTYHRRHRKRTGLLLGLISLVTLGLYLIVALGTITVLGPIQPEQSYLQKISRVQPRADRELDPALVAQVRTQPTVDKVIPEIWLPIAINTLAGNDTFSLMGVQEADLAGLMVQAGVTLQAGRLLRPRTNEMLLSAELAANLGLHLGDPISRDGNSDNFFAVRTPLTLVGLLAGETRLGLLSYEYLSSHELYRTRVNYSILVTAKPGQAAALDAFLTNTIRSPRVEVNTLSLFLAERAAVIRSLVWLFGPIAGVVTLVLTLVTAVINQIELTRRLPELGIFAIIGYGKNWLQRRLTLETALIALAGWAVGIAVPWLLLALVERFWLGPRGYPFQPLQPTAFLLTLPIPPAIVATALWRMARTFGRLDGIAIIEHGELTATRQPGLPPTDAVSKRQSWPKPLASFTYYQRHRGRAAMLIGTMMLMILAVVLLVLTVSTSIDATRVAMGDLQRLSIVGSLNERGLEPGVAAQVRTHPTVAHTIPAVEFTPLSITIPPFSNIGLTAYAVGAEELAQLVQLYQLQIKSGRLPRPRTNEIIIPESAALNRNLKVGDQLGGEPPAYPDAPVLATPLVISGIFARAADRQAENWLAFASLAFMQSHDGYAGSPALLLVIPKAGQQQAMDDWLTSAIASNQVDVFTYAESLRNFETNWRNILTVIALVEGVITLVAALALAVLHAIFIGQRQSEFGVLNALGYGRRWLIRRTMRESLLTTAIAWGLSLLLCALLLLYLQAFVFQPLGLAIDFFNPLPWYFTLPVPLAVLLAGALTGNRLLRRLDPVAMIEKS